MNKSLFKIALLYLILLIVLALGSLFLGSVSFDFRTIFSALLGEKNAANSIIFELRLPRVLLAIAVGGGLSVAGTVLQSILKNPLAEPYILGISSGGIFGTLLAMLLGLPFFISQIFSFSGSLLVIAIIFFIVLKFKSGFNSVTLLLSGVMIGAFFGALILIILTLMRENLQTALFWLVGTLSFADASQSYYAFVFAVLLSIIISLFGYRLNLIAIGDEKNEAIGINLKNVRITLLILTGILTGGLVAVSGIIGFIGMIIPHIVRNKYGYDNRVVLPISFLVGAIVLLISDTVARIVILPAELPVGAITAFFGAPVFIWFLKKKDYYFTS